MAAIRGITTVNANAIAVLIDSSGQLGTVSSSCKVKENICDLGDESDFIFNLRPVRFNYIQDSSHTKQWGLIAEEVNEVFPEFVVLDENKEPMSVRYHDLSVLLLNELQKQNKIIQDLLAREQNLLVRVADLEDREKDTKK